MHFLDAFEHPREQVEVEITVPTHRAVVSPEVSGATAPSVGGFTLSETEMGEEPTPFAAWVSLSSRLRAVARAMGGGIAMETHKSMATGAERHVIRYVGPELEV